jgi:hypothetical protein
VFNVIVFLLAQTFTTAFWVSYGFIHFSYLMFVLSAVTMPKVKDSLVLGYPILYVSFLYFIVSFLIGVLFMFFNNAGFVLAFIPQLIVSGVYTVAYVLNLIANEYTISNEAKSSQAISYMKHAASELHMLMGRTVDTALRKKLEALYDAVRSSQVTSHPAVAGEEQAIMSGIEELKRKVGSSEYSEAGDVVERVGRLLTERDNKIRSAR